MSAFYKQLEIKLTKKKNNLHFYFFSAYKNLKWLQNYLETYAPLRKLCILKVFFNSKDIKKWKV